MFIKVNFQCLFSRLCQSFQIFQNSKEKARTWNDEYITSSNSEMQKHCTTVNHYSNVMPVHQQESQFASNCVQGKIQLSMSLKFLYSCKLTFINVTHNRCWLFGYLGAAEKAVSITSLLKLYQEACWQWRETVLPFGQFCKHLITSQTKLQYFP